ncbi:MAG: thiamine-phosphate kinase, partial [Bacteroidetes bacterium CG02_land_8_20_14_3_00_31_25]
APEIAALNGGEDYELLFTVSLKDYEKIKNLKEISVIGNIIDESDGMNLISDDGKQIPITAQGWNGIK